MGKTGSGLGKMVRYGEQQSGNSFPHLSLLPPKVDVLSFTPGFSTSPLTGLRELGLGFVSSTEQPLPLSDPTTTQHQGTCSSQGFQAVNGLR